MPGIDFTVALPGLDPVTVGLSRLRTEIADWRPFWTEHFAPSFYYQVMTDFVTEGANSGTRWAPLSPAYATWKQQRFPGKGILMRSGALRASLAQGGPQSVFRASPTTLEIGTSVPYAGYHQLGTGRMPQRPPMRISAAFMGAMGKVLQKFVQDTWTARKAEAAAAAAAADTLGGA